MILALVLLPAVAGIAAFLIRSNPVRRVLLVGASAGHLALVAWCWIDRTRFPALGTWIAIDAPGLLFLSIASLLFLSASLYAAGFLRREAGEVRTDSEEGFLFGNIPEAIFTACLLGFLAAMSLVTMSQHFGLLWVAVEATTLVSAPLIHYHRHHRSLEAAWKYLLICSVGIAVALLGTFFLTAAASGSGTGLTFASLISNAASLDPVWLKAAFLLLLVGYGTKMGLVPLHTWLPDAHSEAPPVVSALLSGALLNCAFLGILRVQGVLAAAGIAQFGRETLLVFGLVSMAVAAVFILGQADYKRMLAYSSVENMGILAVGIGLGGLGDWGSLYHAVNHSLVKASLFFAAGNILAAYGTKRSSDAQGVMKTIPVTGVLWVAGFFAITGAPPFGTFVSELAILRAAVEAGSYGVAVIFSLSLLAAFIGMVSVFAGMAQGTRRSAVPGSVAAAAASHAGAASPAGAGGHAPGPAAVIPAPRSVRESILQVASPIGLLGLAAVLGLFVPHFIDALVREAARFWGA